MTKACGILSPIFATPTTWRDHGATTGQYFDFESDEALEAVLRRELIEIARFNGVSDPETLRDILFATMPPVTPAP